MWCGLSSPQSITTTVSTALPIATATFPPGCRRHKVAFFAQAGLPMIFHVRALESNCSQCCVFEGVSAFFLQERIAI